MCSVLCPLILFLSPSFCLSLPSKQSSEPGCRWKVSLFSLLNFPTSGRFLTDSHTPVPLFLRTSLLGACEGSIRTQCWAVRNLWASCLTQPYDSHLPHFPPCLHGRAFLKGKVCNVIKVQYVRIFVFNIQKNVIKWASVEISMLSS